MIHFSLRQLTLVVLSAFLCGVGWAQENRLGNDEQQEAVRRAVVVVGLPGDQEHERLFERVSRQWLAWLTDELQFSRGNVALLSGRGGNLPNADGPAVRESIQQAAQALAEQSQPQDVAWVFFLGHANYDDERAYFHLPGPDIHDVDIAAMFDGLQCKEQVFWLTHACSGWFLKALSRPGRIVITATSADLEFNETEFPQALAAVSQTPHEELDENGDDTVSLAELFVAVDKKVQEIYAADMRAPTEHAMLDDDGDGEGTEAGDLAIDETPPPGQEETPASVAARVKLPDGELAAEVFLPITPPAERTDEGSALLESDSRSPSDETSSSPLAQEQP